jgi:preprotein translocase subunit YajC
MINLIPPIGQAALKHEYILKVVTCHAFLLAGVFLAGSVLLIPSYVLVQSQLKSERSQSEEVMVTQNEFKGIQAELERAQELLVYVQPGDAVISASGLFETVVQTATPGITFKAFEVVPVEGVVSVVTVLGVAKNRTELAAFKNAVEDLPLFETATIPLSDLAKEENLPFALTLTLASEGNE